MDYIKKSILNTVKGSRVLILNTNDMQLVNMLDENSNLVVLDSRISESDSITNLSGGDLDNGLILNVNPLTDTSKILINNAFDYAIIDNTNTKRNKISILSKNNDTEMLKVSIKHVKPLLKKGGTLFILDKLGRNKYTNDRMTILNIRDEQHDYMEKFLVNNEDLLVPIVDRDKTDIENNIHAYLTRIYVADMIMREALTRTPMLSNNTITDDGFKLILDSEGFSDLYSEKYLAENIVKEYYDWNVVHKTIDGDVYIVNDTVENIMIVGTKV